MVGKLPRDLGVILVGFYVYELVYENEFSEMFGDIWTELSIILTSIMSILLIHHLAEISTWKDPTGKRRIFIIAMAIFLFLITSATAVYVTGINTGILYALGLGLVLLDDFSGPMNAAAKSEP